MFQKKIMLDGAAGAGMVLRDSAGEVIFTACRLLLNSRDVVEAELTSLNIIAETDCVEAFKLIKESTPNTSMYAARVRVIRELLTERDVELARVDRNANCVSHELARFGRVNARTEFWLGTFPLGIGKYIADDCNPIIII
jgi:hypothetical protein